MPWLVKAFLVAGALLVIVSGVALADGVRFLRFVRRKLAAPPGSYTPRAAVIIPCKGVDQGFEANVEAFLNQGYADYQVVLVVATPTEIAHQKLRERLQAGPVAEARSNPRTVLVAAGIAEGRGEKVNNLRRGVEAADGAAEVLVFADIDATPPADWLASLVAPLANSEVTVSTGFRWYLPGNGFVSKLRAAWDTSIATTLGEKGPSFAWGGSMAIRAGDFRRMGVAEKYWASTVSDDYAMTRAVREARGRISFEPRCLVASREESSLQAFLGWSTRQMTITRVYATHLWKLGLATSAFYCATMLLGVIAFTLPGAAANARPAVAGIIAVVLLLGGAKGYIRSIVAKERFRDQLSGGAWCYWLLSPLVPWVMLGNFTAAGLTRRIKWRGTEYELVSRDEVRVISRTEAEPPFA